MKPLHLTILTILSAMVFNSCKNKDDEIINGDVKLTVVEYGSNKPIKNAAVGLLKRTSGSGLGGSNYSIITTANTDENGYVNFGYQKDWSNLYIDVQHPNYYDMSNTSCQQIAKDNYKVVLNGIAYLGLSFISKPNENKERILRSNYNIQISQIDTTYNFIPVIANDKKSIYYAVFKDLESANTGINILYDSTITLTAPKLLDTAYYTITY